MSRKAVFIIVVLIISAFCVLDSIISDIVELSTRKGSISFMEWFTPAIISLIFIALSIIKFRGQKHGLVGGGGKPWKERLMSGYCPTWSRLINLAAPYVLLGIGLFHLGIIIWLLFVH